MAGDFAPYPPTDPDREARVIQDVCDLLQEPTPSDETKRKVTRWIGHILRDATLRGPWWFAQALVTPTVEVGEDLIDLTGDIDRVQAVVADRRLLQVALPQIMDLRADAARRTGANSYNYPTLYALEAGRRVHLWPAPAISFTLQVLYQRPLVLSIVPDEWEMIVLDGVLGRYGRHFDRDALTQDPVAFEARYSVGLARARADSRDLVVTSRALGRNAPGSTLVAASADRTVTAVEVPVSVPVVVPDPPA